ncbi:heterokaryon incompatibility protein-domain-containing protein [Paraphoma chrysanthemicola]|uniref:Heterokaryon incompatibility protein-domain-containing protein n=1 Tax=Paraphoma chrysanthemicola TaxID=798071 RepID=A0A8K0R357_9PLEO|nr:heterokaryon incompatibility protein-domain-containing protein [Paraphoma chrysanthemicola]
MRLIDTSTGIMKEFIGSDIPAYAILSHTWEDDEITYKDYIKGRNQLSKGYEKITQTCSLARENGVAYAWIDTCCIDKRSSAELTEAINSMYLWYERAIQCYVFLSDLELDTELETALPRCRWFTRGWTLQELIANRNVTFFDSKWNHRGTKLDLARHLSEITLIDEDMMKGNANLSDFCVATKMSWAAKRSTTRIEDRAYCLLGLFEVNMPLLYGEGEKAFQRLQEEIIRSTPDFSIFAWTKPARSRPAYAHRNRIYCGILATSPSDFNERPCAGRGPLKQEDFNAYEFALSNFGLRTRAHIESHQTDSGGHSYVLPLQYLTGRHSANDMTLGVRLRKCGPDRFVREDPWTLFHGPRGQPHAFRERYYLTSISKAEQRCLTFTDDLFIEKSRNYALQVQRPPEVDIYDAWPWSRYDDEDQVFFAEQSIRDCCMMRLWVKFQVRVGRRDVVVGSECVFYAVGWASESADDIQCTLFKNEANSKSVNEIQTLVADLDHDRGSVIHELIYHHIPKQKACVYNIPGTMYSVYVSYQLTPTPLRMRSPRISSWTVKFFTETYETANVPLIDEGQWYKS